MAEEYNPAAPPKAKSGLFGKSKPVPELGPSAGEMTEKLNSLAARVRISEERYGELRKKPKQKLKEFSEIIINEEEVCPLLIGSYKGMACYKMKKIDIKDLSALE